MPTPPLPPTAPTSPAARARRPAWCASRRGSIYISVLGVSVMVLVIGIGAILVGRIQARTASGVSDFAEARLAARSGLELAMLAVYNDPYWRKNRGNGTWFVDRSMPSGGAFSVTASDPVDNDVTVGDNNPVVLTCTGAKGAARYIMRMRMEVGARKGSCLEAALSSNKDLTINGATLNCDQTLRSNAAVNGINGAVINCTQVEGATAVSGGTYNGTTVVTGSPTTLPDASTVFDYYTANGTGISYSSLRQVDGELIANGSFELNQNGWYTLNGCSIQRIIPIARDGVTSLRVYGRDTADDAVATDLNVSAMVPGHTYALSCSVYPLTSATTVRVTLTLNTDRGAVTVSTPYTPASTNTWTDIKTTVILPTAGGWLTATSATLSVESTTVNRDYYVDAVSFKDTTLGNAYMMEGRLLSPTNNPFGLPNSKGIYIVNCSGKDVIVTDTRVIGTLVMLNPGPNSALRGSVIIEPASPDFPALMVNDKMSISLSAAALSESRVAMNFNPPGSPYPYAGGAGTFTNATALDSYPSAINGLVYAKEDLTIDTNTTINGVVVGNGGVNVNGAAATLRYNNYYLNNPPPGFTRGSIDMKPVPGTWQRTAN